MRATAGAGTWPGISRPSRWIIPRSIGTRAHRRVLPAVPMIGLGGALARRDYRRDGPADGRAGLDAGEAEILLQDGIILGQHLGEQVIGLG